ncbi:MAG: hypothetical protein IT330_01640 [Anaerolineae bacterium]|nr:hypothetical protein [Anaerolineae bacterium]
MWGYHGVELTIRLIRFSAAIMVGLTVGIVSASLLAMIATVRGFNGDQVFNLFGIIITISACLYFATADS